MATPYRIAVSPKDTGLLGYAQTEAASRAVSELLQKDLETRHCFFNDRGFHNHISHHLLALYGTGAQAPSLERAVATNDSYQKAAIPPHGAAPEDLLRDWDTHAPNLLGKNERYPDFLLFFQREIEKSGWERVLDKFLFRGDARSDDMLQRMFCGVLHPLIQLMYGVEFAQPAIIAEALAQAAAHVNKRGTVLAAAESATKSASSCTGSITSLFADAAADPPTTHPLGRNTDYNGELGDVFDRVVALAAGVRVRPEELDERIAEMFHMTVVHAAAAAAKEAETASESEPKFDFILMHHVNVAPVFAAINQLDWIPVKTKTRMLEWKIRLDMLPYVSKMCQPLDIDPVLKYVPRTSQDVKLVMKPAGR